MHDKKSLRRSATRGIVRSKTLGRRPEGKQALVIILCIVSLTPGIGFSQSIKEISFATWNAENLFDDINDSGAHDNEVMTWWSHELYQKKLTRLAEVIAQMNSGKGPDILALVEVENARVIADLVRKLPNPQSYTIVHIEGEASRGIEVGLITRFPVLAQISHFVWHGIRDILQVELDVYGHRLTVLVVHWKSRVGGTFETADLRTICASRTYQLYRDIVRKNPDADVLICGDFNDTPHNLSITDVLNAKASREKVLRQRGRNYLYNCTTELLGKSPSSAKRSPMVSPPPFRSGQALESIPSDLPRSIGGTHFYDHEWSFLDQIIVSKGMLDHQGLAYQPGSIAVFNPNGVLVREGVPWRFGGKKEQNRGYSDHLPLVARFWVDGR